MSISSNVFRVGHATFAPSVWRGVSIIAALTMAFGGLSLSLAYADESASRTPTVVSSGSVSGRVFQDMNANSADDTDPGVTGWTVSLRPVIEFTVPATEANSRTVAGDAQTQFMIVIPPTLGPGTSTTTAANGSYTFTDVAPGKYVVCETVPSGWTQSFPVSGSTMCGAGTFGHEVTIRAGGVLTGKDFGNWNPASISGMKWNDADGNATSTNEQRLSHWSISAVSSSQATTTVQTTSDGTYTIISLKPGTYIVFETAQTGWIQTYPISSSYTLTLQSGEATTSIDFGNAERATVKGTKWNDANGNKIRDGGEQGIVGWVFTATPIAALGGAVATSTAGSAKIATTTAEGVYTFSFLPSELGAWRITEVQQAGWESMAPASSTHEIIVASGTAITGLDFGNMRMPTISGSAWRDQNRDGIWQSVGTTTETGLRGWVLVATPANASGTPETARAVKNATTTSDGSYRFTFATGEYGYWLVTEVQHSGWQQTYPTSTPYLILVGTTTTTTSINFGNFQEPVAPPSSGGGGSTPPIGNGPISVSVPQNGGGGGGAPTAPGFPTAGGNSGGGGTVLGTSTVSADTGTGRTAVAAGTIQKRPAQKKAAVASMAVATTTAATTTGTRTTESQFGAAAAGFAGVALDWWWVFLLALIVLGLGGWYWWYRREYL